jgi:hypothetical protein
MGWRRSWWAEHEPYFSKLKARSDFRSLISHIEATNRDLRAQMRMTN